MSTFLLGVTTLIYFGVAIDQLIKVNYGMAITFVAYGIANIGLIIASK